MLFFKKMTIYLAIELSLRTAEISGRITMFNSKINRLLS